jgi:hypothetical protein
MTGTSTGPWNLGNTGSERAAVALTPDFHLAPGSPGKGKAAGGKDQGADVDLVGPGPAYQRWLKSDDYRQWRKKAPGS